jgi:HAD superfamily hydrolase (TIGR01549 family)
MPQLQVLTFDFHNTLIHCDPWFELEVRTLPREVARALDVGTTLDDAEIDNAYRVVRQQAVASGIEVDAFAGVRQVFDRLGLDVAASTLAPVIDDLMWAVQDSVEAVDGAVETVKWLATHGVRLGVVSSAVHHQTLDWSLRRIGLGGTFQHVVTSASCGYYKSSTAIYNHALALLGATAPMSVHVGDSLKWDVTVSRQAGMHPVWLQSRRPETFSQGLPTTEPALTLQSLVGAGPILMDLLAAIRSEHPNG